MRQFETAEEAYDVCLADGNIIPIKDVSEEIIRTSLCIVEEDLQSAIDAAANKRWNSAYKTYYDVLHQLVEAFVRFDTMKIKTHLCLFTYICVKHPELELHWDFFEKVRTKRNGIQYYASLVTEKDWKEAALTFQLYIDLFKKKIEEKLN
ncbi:hypothetical protein HYX11_01760 [Candidatus Woesearchaeota archaeon]|nr:hypothetical protein [Candidatus Woesearchaeota archaeon]